MLWNSCSKHIQICGLMHQSNTWAIRHESSLTGEHRVPLYLLGFLHLMSWKWHFHFTFYDLVPNHCMHSRWKPPLLQWMQKQWMARFCKVSRNRNFFPPFQTVIFPATHKWSHVCIRTSYETLGERQLFTDVLHKNTLKYEQLISWFSVLAVHPGDESCMPSRSKVGKAIW